MEKFCLRWNEFETNIGCAFNDLREEKDFFDVTLVCEDSQVEAHKVVLSACSPFFRSILRRNPHHHPLLYLKGVTYRDLTSLLNFMYRGQVNVAQEELNTFLTVAEDLKVKGLTQGSHQTPVKGEKTKSLSKTQSITSGRASSRKDESINAPRVSPPEEDADIKCISVKPPPPPEVQDITEAEDVPAKVDHDPSYNPAYEEQYLETEHPRDDQGKDYIMKVYK